MLHKVANPLQNCQLKFSSSEQGVFEGYASVFDSVDAVGDTIKKGAFTESLASGRSIKMFVNHKQHEVPVGDWHQLKEDSHGLMATGKIDLNHKDGPTVYSALKRAAMDGLSIGFTMGEGDFDVTADGGRVIKNTKLMEVSLVNFPCEGGARISAVKADILGLVTLKDFEDYLREVGGFSKSMAVTLVSQMAKAVRSDYEHQRQQMTKAVGAEVLGIIEQLKSKL